MKGIKISTYPLKLKSFNGQKLVFDPIRKKFVAFTPEEFVRQNMIMHLLKEMKYSEGLMAVEYPMKNLDTSLRCDIVVFSPKGLPRVIIECKAPGIKLGQAVVDQATLYNSKLDVEYLVLTNGAHTYCCMVDLNSGGYMFLDDLPGWNAIAQ
jgi:hypothetical protein